MSAFLVNGIYFLPQRLSFALLLSLRQEDARPFSPAVVMGEILVRLLRPDRLLCNVKREDWDRHGFSFSESLRTQEQSAVK